MNQTKTYDSGDYSLYAFRWVDEKDVAHPVYYTNEIFCDLHVLRSAHFDFLRKTENDGPYRIVKLAKDADLLNLQSEKIARLPKTESLLVTAASLKDGNRKYAVALYGGKTCFVHKSALEKNQDGTVKADWAAPDGVAVSITKSQIYAYTLPNLESKKNEQLKKGATVLVVGQVEDFYVLQLYGKIVYVSIADIDLP